MSMRIGVLVSLVGVLILPVSVPLALACCPAPPSGRPVVNADQTVIIIWDAATKTQHFIRQASFKSEADDFGFLVPTPTQPELDESGNDAFPYLLDVTKPEIQTIARPSGGVSCGCGGSITKSADARWDAPPVKVLEEKMVAGFHAQVLEAKSATALVGWLKEHGYAFSPEVEAWAKPYVEAGWKITALKVAKDDKAKEKKTVTAAALRLSFKTERPIFPYREPDSKSAAEAVGASERLLRIYFLSDAQYKGELTKETPWTGKVAWAGKLDAAQRDKILEQLKLPKDTGPSQWWLTEFEDNWPYKVAPADVYFSRDDNQETVRRPPIIRYAAVTFPNDVTAIALVAAVFLPPLLRRACRHRKKRNAATT